MGKKTQGQKDARKSSRTIWMVAGAALIAVAALITLSLRSSQGETKATEVRSDQELGAVRNVKGHPDARVVVTEWHDYL